MWRSIQLRPVEVVVLLLLLDRIYTVTLVATRFSFGHHVTVGIFFFIFFFDVVFLFFSFFYLPFFLVGGAFGFW